MPKKIVYGIAISLLLLTPFMYSNEQYNGVISAKQIWFYGAMALMMVITAIDLFFDRRFFILRFNKIDLALLAFYIYYTIRAATTPYMPLLHNQRWINWSLCVVMYFIIKRINNEELIIKNKEDEGINNEELKIKNIEIKEESKNEELGIKNSEEGGRIFHFSFFIINFLILTALGQAIWGLLQLYGFLPSFNGYFKITGTFFNPAPYAMYLSVIFPLALGRIINKEKLKIKNEKLRIRKIQKPEGRIFSCIKYPILFLIINSSFLIYCLSFATVIAILLILPATMIRAAWLAAAVGALVVAWPWIKQHTPLGTWILVTGSKLKYKIAAVIIALVVIGGTCTALFCLKKDSAIGKLFIWEVTLGKIAEKPMFGYGVGRFEAEYNNWQAAYFMKHPEEMDGPKGLVAGNTKYCFNEFLEITAETGLVGLLLFGSILILAFEGALRLRMKELTQKNKKRFDSSFFIISFLIVSFLSFPFYNLPLLLSFFTVLAIISLNKQTIAMPFKPIIILPYSFTTVLFVFGGWFGFKLSQNHMDYKIWYEANSLYGVTEYDTAEKDFEMTYKSCKYNNEFLQQYGKCLAMNKDFAKAKCILDEAAKFGGDYMLYANLGDASKELKQYPQAEFAYKQSIYMMPHKLYPHYLLAKLYLQSGDSIKAKNKAREVLNMNAKVNNLAEDEIKQEMKNIIKNMKSF